MTVLLSIPVTVTCEQVTACLDGGTLAPAMDTEIRTAALSANQLIRPKAVCQWVDVVSVDPASLTVISAASGVATILETGPPSRIWRHAEKILVSVVTIGPRLDSRVREMNRSRDPLGAYLLDCAGIAALNQAGAAVCRMAEDEARRKHWGVGHLAGPGGSDGWPLDEQLKVCDLLALDRIGVSMGDRGALIPLKSVSGLIPIGAGYRKRRVGSSCRFCSGRDACRMRSTA
ncbi:MAG: hypothetical protein ABIL58_23680 [Pseudomonadota bacterium]